MLGNSPQVLLTHYAELVSKQDCEKFWSIPPVTARACAAS